MSAPNALQALQARLGLSAPDMARYLGVPLPTWRKWASGERAPPAALWRLIEVLGLIEALVPDLHNQLINSQWRQV